VTPTLQAQYIGFSSTKLGRLVLRDTQNVTGVSVEIWEPILDFRAAAYELTQEEIEAGVFEIPPTETGELYFAHREEYDAANTWPENLELRVTVRYDSPEGEKTLSYRQLDQPEQGWGIRYWPEDEEKTDWSYPGYFRFSTYESMIPISLVIDDPKAVVTRRNKMVISVSLSIDGRAIRPEECELVEEKEEDPLADYYPEGAEIPTYYYARLYLKRPTWAPESGTIHVTVVQKLSGDGSIWTTEQDYDY
jgi:hypothetical protein